ncbi:hypothetical protein EMIT0P253_70093 [Pseudomonas sp. IT-P253]
MCNQGECGHGGYCHFSTSVQSFTQSPQSVVHRQQPGLSGECLIAIDGNEF